MSKHIRNTFPIGTRFGRLVIKEETRKVDLAKGKSYIRLAYICECDCGSIRIVGRYYLEKGITKSCGCLAADLASARRKNSYDPAINLLYIKYKNRAKHSGFDWELTVEDCIEFFSKNCYYCGVEPRQIVIICRGKTIYNGIDRVDNTKGYTLDNIVPCCTTCNYAKRDLPLEEFYNWINQLIRFQTK